MAKKKSACVKLKLYITGTSVYSKAALDNLRKYLHSHKLECKLEVIDVLSNPLAADEARVLATPLLVRESPLPVRRIVGDLSNIALLGLKITLGGRLL